MQSSRLSVVSLWACALALGWSALAVERDPAVLGAKLVSEAADIVARTESFDEFQKDPSALALFPKIRELTDKLNAMRSQAKDPDPETRKKLSALSNELYMVCQAAGDRCVSPEIFKKELKDRCKRYQENREKRKGLEFSAEQVAILENADGRAKRFLSGAGAADVVKSTKPPSTAVDENLARKRALIEEEFTEQRKVIVKADAVLNDVPPKIKAIQAQLVMLASAVEAAQTKAEEISKKNNNAETTAALQNVTKKRDEHFNAKEKVLRYESEVESAKHSIRNACLIMKRKAQDDAYARQLLQDPAKQTAGEKRWTAQFKKVVIMKNGNTEEVISVEDLGGMWKITSDLGDSREVDKRDVSEIKDIK